MEQEDSKYPKIFKRIKNLLDKKLIERINPTNATNYNAYNEFEEILPTTATINQDAYDEENIWSEEKPRF